MSNAKYLSGGCQVSSLVMSVRLDFSYLCILQVTGFRTAIGFYQVFVPIQLFLENQFLYFSPEKAFVEGTFRYYLFIKTHLQAIRQLHLGMQTQNSSAYSIPMLYSCVYLSTMGIYLSHNYKSFSTLYSRVRHSKDQVSKKSFLKKP